MARGNIRQRSSGSWTLQVYLGRDPATGKKRYQSETVKGKKRDAYRRLTELIHEIDAGTYVRPTRETIAEFLPRWLQEHAIIKDLRPRTIERYTADIHRHIVPELGYLRLSSLQPQHVQTFITVLKGKGLSPTTVLQYHSLLSQAINAAVRMGILARNPCHLVELPRRPKETQMTVLDSAQIKDFLEKAHDSRLYPVILIAVLTGMRRGELLALRWSDVDFNTRTIRINRALTQTKAGPLIFGPTKSGRTRTVAMPDEAVGMLRQIREQWDARLDEWAVPFSVNETLVFHRYDGTPFSPEPFSQAFRRLRDRIGYHGLRFHDLRHTNATLSLEAGIPMKVISERLGHTTLRLTSDLYTHVTPGIQEDAMEAWGEKFGPNLRQEWQGNGKPIPVEVQEVDVRYNYATDIDDEGT